jgi:hypothetical protein
MTGFKGGDPPFLVLVQVRGQQREAPVGAVHVQDVALVVYELHLHALDVDGAEVDALVGLQGGAELNVGLARHQVVRFDGDERQDVGGGGPGVAVQRGDAAVLQDCVDGVELGLRELARGGLHVDRIARCVAINRGSGREIRRHAEPGHGGGNSDQALVQVVLVVVVQHEDDVLRTVRVRQRLGGYCVVRGQRVPQRIGNLVSTTIPHEPTQVGIQLGCGGCIHDVLSAGACAQGHIVRGVKKQEVVGGCRCIGDRHFAAVDVVCDGERASVEWRNPAHVRLKLGRGVIAGGDGERRVSGSGSELVKQEVGARADVNGVPCVRNLDGVQLDGQHVDQVFGEVQCEIGGRCGTEGVLAVRRDGLTVLAVDVHQPLRGVFQVRVHRALGHRHLVRLGYTELFTLCGHVLVAVHELELVLASGGLIGLHGVVLLQILVLPPLAELALRSAHAWVCWVCWVCWVLVRVFLVRDGLVVQLVQQHILRLLEKCGDLGQAVGICLVDQAVCCIDDVVLGRVAQVEHGEQLVRVVVGYIQINAPWGCHLTKNVLLVLL